MRDFLKCQSQAYNQFFHLHIIPMTLYKDIMPYFEKFMHVYGWNLSVLWSPSKIWTPKSFSIANFRHPVSKSWLRPCMQAQFFKLVLPQTHICVCLYGIEKVYLLHTDNWENICPKQAGKWKLGQVVKPNNTCQRQQGAWWKCRETQNYGENIVLRPKKRSCLFPVTVWKKIG